MIRWPEDPRREVTQGVGTRAERVVENNALHWKNLLYIGVVVTVALLAGGSRLDNQGISVQTFSNALATPPLVELLSSFSPTEQAKDSLATRLS